ncbi:MAG: 16S rRNA (cytidine(1402)-2'-O)-methyltransferase [Oscillospiraceae bacterium]|jgi:16S rRNA (cytidine1402-2'-O)-methyltransferase
MSALYLVATPIGNLGDISHRALEILRQCDFIAAEDTRVTQKLLNHFGIRKPLVSYYEHNRAASGRKILERLIAGESCALVTDAGTPIISDPGFDIVSLCLENDVRVESIPGPCAAVTALTLSNLPSGRFCFEGFLSVNKRARREHLESIKNEKRTMVFYEAPHKLVYTLNDLLETLGDRRISICRELTKIHEEVLRTTLSRAAAHFSEVAPKGEFVLVVEGAPEAESENGVSLEEAVELVRAKHEGGMKLRDAAREVAAETGLNKNELYNAAVE